MRKLHIALLSVFGIGVLLGGIGTGVAIGEYSSLEYKGLVMLGEENLVTKEFYYDFSTEEEESVLLSYCHWGDGRKDTLLVEDESVPAGTVRYLVTYNEEMVRPELINWKQERNGDDWDIADSYNEEEDTWEAAEDGEDVNAENEGDNDAAEAKKKHRVVLELRNNWIGNEFDVMMRNKDQILQDIKHKKIASYEIADITDVEIHVNPASIPYIEDETR